MEFMLERIGPSYYACYILNIRCIINGSFGTRKTCACIFGRFVCIEFVFC